jgi:Cu+-exporting ATPase
MSCCCQSVNPEPRDEQSRKAERINSMLWFKFGITALLAGLTMYLSLAANISRPEGLARIIIHAILALTSLSVMIGIGWPMFRSGWKRAFEKKVTLEHAFLIGVIGSFSASIYSSLTDQGAIYYEVVVVLIAIYYFGQTITAQQIKKHSDLSHSIPGLTGVAAVIGPDGSDKATPVESLKVGQRVRIIAGNHVPVDGEILTGTAYVEQQSHTGETYPQVKNPGDTLLAGSLVLDGEITLRATSSGQTREIDRLLGTLTGAADLETETLVLAQKILNFFVPVVLFIALATGLSWTLMGAPQEGWLNALTVTVVACPCALGVAIPLAIRRGLASLKLLGIIPKEASFIDRLANVTAVAFDKTGTLSDPRLELDSLDIEPHANENLKSWIVAIQKKSIHPVARPFWSLSEENLGQVEDLSIETIPGRGISARFRSADRDQELLIGNHHLACESGISLSSANLDQRSLFIIQSGKLAATARLKEQARETSIATLNELHQLGYQTGILTGDSTIPSSYLLPNLSVSSGLSSSEKSKRIAKLNAKSSTLYIGDGLNDCESFRAADASISLKSGSLAAQEISQAILLHDNLSVIPTALKQIKELRNTLNRILIFSFCYNAIGITLAALGILHPIVAAVLMFASSIFVIAWHGKR